MNRLTFCALLAASVFANSAVYAQATVNGHSADFDQYPSFLQTSIHLPNNVETVLRCGYSQNGAQVVPDPGYMETSVLDPSANAYARYQRIDNKIIITAPNPNMPNYFLLQVTEPNGLTSAKSCQMDLNSDTIQNCATHQAFVAPAAATQQDQTAAQQCGSLFNKAMPQMNATEFSPQKTDLFKANLRQKVAIIEAP